MKMNIPLAYLAILFSMFFIGCVTTATFLPQGVTDKGAFIVEYGADWCPACSYVKPILEKQSVQHNIQFVYFNIDDKENTIDQYYFMPYIPVIDIFKDGKLYYHGPYFDDIIKSLAYNNTPSSKEAKFISEKMRRKEIK